MSDMFLPYQNDEALSAAEFFREIAKADADGLAVVDDDCRVSDLPVHPLSKLFGEVELFHAPSPEQKNTVLQKDVKTIVTKIGSSEVVAELDEHDVVMRAFLKGTR